MGSFGQKLKELRGERSLAKVEAGCGVNRGDIKAYEDEKYLPKLANLKKLGHFYEAYAELFMLYLESTFPESSDQSLIVSWAHKRNKPLQN